ncbi:MAG: glycosyltransferase family 4 protein [Dissulfurispiraceae bacterium]|jgi:glycosyltransferase involved in cell wall biosynthesis|nr:glycosyltransferase family 4 protein [Dissulfurispiraceae bacterium]
MRDRVMLVTRSASAGGLEDRTALLAKNILEQNRSVIWLVLSGDDINQIYRRIPGVRFVRLNDTVSQSILSFTLLPKLAAIIWRLKPRIVQLCGIRPMFLMSLFPFPLKTTRISSVHGSYKLMALNGKGEIIKWKLWISRVFHCFGCIQSKKVITVSNSLLHEMKQICPVLSDKKIFTIHNGVDLPQRPDQVSTMDDNVAVGNSNCRTEEQSLQRMLGVRDGTALVISAGRLSHEKNYECMIKAAKIVLSKLPEIVFAIFGDGYKRRELQSLIDSEGIGSSFILHGFIKDIAALFYQSSIFVLTSFSEGFSNVLLEAGASQVPCVVSAVGGNSEIIQDRKTGLLVEDPGNFNEFAEKIMLLLQDQKLRKEMGKNAMDFVVNEFSQKKQTQNYLRLYNELLVR